MKNFRPMGLLVSVLMLAAAAISCENTVDEPLVQEKTQKETIASLWRDGRQLYRVEPVDEDISRLIFWENDTLMFDKRLDGCKYAENRISESFGNQKFSFHIGYEGSDYGFDYHRILEIELYDLQGQALQASYDSQYDRFYVKGSNADMFPVSASNPLSISFKVLKSNRDFMQCTELLASSWSSCSFEYDQDYRGGKISFIASKTSQGDTDSHLIQFHTGIGFVKYDFQLIYE